MTTEPDKRKAALDFLKANRAGVLATLSPQGEPRARFVYYACDNTFAIYFLTMQETRKVSDLKENQHAAFTVASEKVPQTIQIEGVIENTTEAAIIDFPLIKLTENWLSNVVHGAPLTHIELGSLSYFKLKPTWIRWGDFTASNKEDIFTEIAPDA
jgi:general stress protein 26